MMSAVDLDELAARVLRHEVRAVARAISLIEDDVGAAAGIIRRLFPHTGKSRVVGITGPPGAGKSTLVDAMTGEYRGAGLRVGVLAVDPTSPFSGGAVLGDRVRMHRHFGDPGVFIRSMATRGHLGGVSRATDEAALVLDAAGHDVILVETVGVGQDEIDIVRTADVSVVVLVPGAGDEVQALKAGIMEIADVFVVNKADRDGADRTVAAVESVLALDERRPGAWVVPVLRTEATTGRGVADLVGTLGTFFSQGEPEQAGRRLERQAFRLRELVAARFLARVDRHGMAPGEFDALVARIDAREIDPYTAADLVMNRIASI